MSDSSNSSKVFGYPGLGLPLRHFPQADGLYPMGTHGNCHGAESGLLPVREVAMMAIMEKLTNKESWEKKVFDDGIVAKWSKEALEIPDEYFWKLASEGKTRRAWAAHNDEVDSDTEDDPNALIPERRKDTGLTGIMSQEAFDYCIKELRNKAQYYETSELIPSLDAYATVVKSDRQVSTELQGELRKAFDKLKADQRASPDWHPNSGDMVQDLVHPSMYPLVYSKSRVFQEEVVDVNNAIDKWAGKGTVIQKEINQPATPNFTWNYGIGGSTVPPNFWSDTYQWLPSNLEFQPDGSVKFTSYINNLHPNKYPDIYRTIEKLIDAALPAWDQCLTLEDEEDSDDAKRVGAGRTESRFSHPVDPSDENPENWDPNSPEPPRQKAAERPETSKPEAEVDLQEESEEDSDEFETKEEKTWHRIRKPAQPQPAPFEHSADYYDLEESRKLAVKFKDSGLQIIVKMASIELTPEKSKFPVGSWHVEGQMNEHICATALYYLDSENITSNNLSFRMQTSAYLQEEYPTGQDGYRWMEKVYGTELSIGAPCLQNYGSVETREGRLLAFPNVFQHRVSPFRLIDRTKPGHRRFIVLWLVDPHTRIISTANVPPQQLSWFAEATFSKSKDTSNLPPELVDLLKQRGVDIGDGSRDKNWTLPVEIRDIVKGYFDSEGGALLMSEEEAREHRERLMEVRSAFHDDADKEWHQHSHNFCEH